MGGLTKRCACARRSWSRCRHPWHYRYQWRGKRHYTSLDRLVGRPLKGKTDAEAEAAKIRSAIQDGTFSPVAPAEPQTADGLTLDAYAENGGSKIDHSAAV